MPAGNHAYRVSAVNSLGEGPYCGEYAPPVGPGPSACDLPGILSVNDLNTDGSQNDSGQNTPPDPSVNIRQLFVAEPYLGPGDNQLIFTLKVDPSTAAAPPQSQWYIIWNRRTPAANGSDRRYVAMKTDLSGVPAFEYGDFGPPLPLDGTIPSPVANTPQAIGSADAGSYDPLTGIITIRLATSKADATPLVAGNDLAGLNARSYLARPDGGPRSQNIANDITGDGSYTLVGNASCFVNQPPVARLDANPTAGLAPLTVLFDASASDDPDAGDGVTLYTFNFGNGAPEVTQASPTISYTYYQGSGPSGFFATATVQDQHSLQSLNVASANINVNELPTPGLLTLLDAIVDDGRVQISWYGEDARGPFTVYRRGEEEGYRNMGRVSPRGDGTIVYHDSNVEGGHRYGYRLGMEKDGKEVYSEIAWVEMPRPKLQLAARNNPSHGVMDLALDLDRESHVAVQVFDTAGRLVADLVDTFMEPGSHEIRWEGRDQTGGRAASGLYVVRAQAGDRVVKARAMLVP